MKSLDELFAGVKTAAIAGHIRPDGDCVGSCLATYNYITTYYPQIEVSLYLQPIPNIFKFMKNVDKIIRPAYKPLAPYRDYIKLDDR